MKKQILISLISLCSILTVNSQTWTGSLDINGNLWRNGNIGIGTQTPFAKLQIGGCINAMPDLTALSFIGGNSLRILNDDGNTNYGAFISGNSSLLKLGTRYAGIDNVVLTINQNNVGIGTTNITAPLTVQSGSSASAIKIIGRADDYGYLEFLKNNGSTVSSAIYSKTDRLTLTDATGNDVLSLKGGFVGIGTTSPCYKLDVYGTIRTDEVVVNLTHGCDFVFKSDYKLMDLKELEKFVKTNQHLPEIASEKEMVENGANMKDLQMKLLQKMEEMTLYIIEQNKKIETLENEIKELKTK